jgi:hypothetical protein
MYVDNCVDYLGDPADFENIDAVKRQTWIIENTKFTTELVIVRATCEEQALKRLFNDETVDHTHETICDQCRVNHWDVELVPLEECVNGNELGINECYHQVQNNGQA